ncbi:MAG: chemotaxis protein CheW [Hymenobacteraceae bacterium]|nr:chemotaxis protein CheW [Hymenobacteraceae bacterium]
MKSREQEYRELFAAEALETADALGRHLSELERTPADENAVAESFRLLHNLKASAGATGLQAIADLAHGLETVFGRLRARELPFGPTVSATLFEGIDALSTLVQQTVSGAEVPAPPELTELLTLLEALHPSIDADYAAGSTPAVRASDVEAAVAAGTEPGLPGTRSAGLALSDVISIPVRKLNTLLTLAGELTIDRDRLRTLARELDHPALTQLADHLFRLIEDLQFSVMDARLVAVESLFSKLPRMVRDVARAEGKQVELLLSGQDIQIDRNVLQLVTDSLLHLLRNAVTHGLEISAEREAAGKPALGTIRLSAETDRDRVILTIADDGRGIDRSAVRRKAAAQGLLSAAGTPREGLVANAGENAKLEPAFDGDDSVGLDADDVLNVIFEPGFSTATEVTEFAGRGVGLDVVKLAVESLGGRLRLRTVAGRGTTFTLVLPTSIAVKPALLVEEEDTTYAVPLTYTENVVSLREDELFSAGPVLMTTYDSESLPVVPLRRLLLGVPGLRQLTERADLAPPPYPVVVVRHNNRRVGLLVERFLGQQDIVVKPVSQPLHLIDLYSGLTTLGNGRVCVVLDIPALTRAFTFGRKLVADAAG